jgi:hypothetical protein
MVFDDSPNQIAWCGALLSGKHLELVEDVIRKLRGSPHNDHYPMPGPLPPLHYKIRLIR